MATDNPNLSALVPSRERADALKFSLNSLELEKNNIEVLVWIDDDDPQLGQYHKLFDNNNHIKMFIKPRVGYLQFHTMINYLASQSTGDWLWLWNDDAYMENPNWYDIFMSHVSLSSPKEKPVVYNLSPGKNGFPIVSRKYLEILGHIGGSATCDLWTRRVVKGTGIEQEISGIEPTHRKYGHDAKLGDLIDATYNSVENLRVSWRRDFGGRSLRAKQGQNDDQAKILNWLNQNKREKGADEQE